MKLKRELVKREIAGESFLVPVGKTVYDSNGLYILTELGAWLWDLLPEAKDEEELLQAILREYDVEESVARADLKEYLDKLNMLGIL